MAILGKFSYTAPGSLGEAVSLLESRPAAVVLAGGTDLVCSLKDGSASPGTLVDIKHIPGLDTAAVVGNRLEIGATVTFTKLLESALVQNHLPILAEMAAVVASPAIRNRATLVGNICAAVPCMDSAPVLCVCDAVLKLVGPGGRRISTLKEWFLGPRETALKSGEMVTALSVPLIDGPHGGCYVKMRRYPGQDLAQAGVAVLALPGHRYRVAFGSVAPVPIRAHSLEEFLQGRPLDEATLAGARDLVAESIAPITDIRATKEYRLHMCRVMLERGLKAAEGRLHGEGPAYGSDLV